MMIETYGWESMIVNCINSFYKFIPENVGEIHIWEDYNETSLVPVDDYFTFPELAEMPDYSFIGGIYKGNTLLVNYSGEKSDFLKKNNLVFDYTNKEFINKSLIFETFNYDDDIYPNTPILPQAGSIRELQRLISFWGMWDYKFNIYKFMRFEYESIFG